MTTNIIDYQDYRNKYPLKVFEILLERQLDRWENPQIEYTTVGNICIFEFDKPRSNVINFSDWRE